MPIILLWNDTVAGSLAQFGRWFDSFERSCFLLQRWFERRIPEAERLERLTSSFPVFRFYNEAVAAEIVSLQAGFLLTQPVAGVGEHVERALSRWNVARRISAERRSSRLLPELFRVIEEITGGMLSSIDRFRAPTAGMFDTTQSRAADLFGLTAFTFRVVATSRDEIMQAATHVRNAFSPPVAGAATQPPAGAATTAPESAASTATTLPLAMRLDQLARYVVAAVLVIPTLGHLLGTIGRDLLVYLRYFSLDTFRDLERWSHSLRRRILDVFILDLNTYAQEAVLFLLAARDVIVGHVQFYARIGTEYLRGVIGGVGTFASQMQQFWSGVVDVIHTVLRYGNAVTGINIGPVVHNGLVAAGRAIVAIGMWLYQGRRGPRPYHAPGEFPVTIEELVLNTGPGGRANSELDRAVTRLRAAWDGANWLEREAAAGLIRRYTGTDIPLTLESLQSLVDTLGLRRAAAGAQPRLIFDAGTVPDLDAAIVQPLRAGAAQAIDNIVNSANAGIGSAAGALATTLGRTAEVFDAAASDAVRFHPLRLFRRLTADANTMVQSLFRNQDNMQPPSGLEPVGDAYAQWLIQGGFDTIGAMLAGYIGMMLDEWVMHLETGADIPAEITATSPRHLLERARLGRVHTPEVRIVARAQDLGRPLAARVADRFQAVVQDAYTTGQGRLQGLREVAATRERQATTPGGRHGP